jgi:hypothetical protein
MFLKISTAWLPEIGNPPNCPQKNAMELRRRGRQDAGGADQGGAKQQVHNRTRRRQKLPRSHALLWKNCESMVTKLNESVLYRIYTENTPPYRQTAIRALRRNGFPHFTLFSANGYGPGQRGLEEYSVVIEVLVEDYRGRDTDGKIEAIAGEIRRKNKQQTVLLMRIPAFHKFKDSHRSSKTRRTITGRITRRCAIPTPPQADVDLVDIGGRPIPPGKRASRRGRILAGFGQWEKLLGNGAVVQGSTVRFFSN